MRRKVRDIVLGATGLLLLAASVFTGWSVDKLQENESIKAAIEGFEADDSYLFYDFLGCYRTSKFDKSRPIEICLSSQFSEEEMSCIQNVVDDLNLIFENIKADYRFTLAIKDVDYNSNTDKNVIPVIKELYDTPNKMGHYDHSNNHISLLDTQWETWKYSNLARTFAHELSHGLKLADAYLLDHETAPTVMQKNPSSSDSPHGFFMENDILLFASLEGNLKTDEDYDNVKSFTKNYCEQRDTEYHFLEARYSVELQKQFYNVPPHVSWYECSLINAGLLTDYLSNEWQRYYNGEITDEDIENARLIDETYIKIKQDNVAKEVCNEWMLNPESVITPTESLSSETITSETFESPEKR